MKINKSIIEYLELDENRYIEKDKFKIRLHESDNKPKSGTWEELWSMVRSDIEKIAEYENNNLRHQSD